MTSLTETPTCAESALLLDLYRQMLLIRRFEERCNALFLQGRIPSTLHLYIGQEAVAVGVCSALGPEDYITSTHRPHGHALAKGVNPGAIMAELYAKATGCCKAKGGSMHVGDMEVGMPPAIAIVGAGAPIAVGAALSAKMRRSGQIVVCFFGEGGANEGAVHEAMNMAAIWRLPVLFVCENNLYGASTPVSQVVAVKDIADRAAAYGMPGRVVDGNDVLAVREAASEAAARARRGEGPTLIECKTYRLCGHSRSDACNYRSREEEAEWRAKDPLLRLQQTLRDEPFRVDTAALDRIEAEVTAVIDDAVAFAETSPNPAAEDTLKHVFWEDR
ncbi:MAG TPA: thiamine pyrophosphate-dependent dehydrogenase E1 component subunit alpha [Chthonomonadaceae bacterium]|nr:thiamine pyrophosphate-dependent dehydrogenase E1 component subunit alpha [Chthonomonadaceae bacterium]